MLPQKIGKIPKLLLTGLQEESTVQMTNSAGY